MSTVLTFVFAAFLQGIYRDPCSPPVPHALVPITVASPQNHSTVEGTDVQVVIESRISDVQYPVPVENIVDVELVPDKGRVMTWQPHTKGIVKSITIPFGHLSPNTLYRLVLTEKDASVPPTCPGIHEIKSVIGEFQTAE